MSYKFEADGGISIESSQSGAANACIRSIKVMSDTKDPHVTARSSTILCRVEAEIRINAGTKEALKNLMQWALAVKGSETDIYRTVTITVTDDANNDEIIRKFTIPQMFVEDYTEHFFENANANEDSIAILKLIQKNGHFEDIDNS